MSEKIFLVDGSGYIFRAFYAVQPLSTRDGFPTNALYGFTRMLVKLVQDAQADHICVVFDSGRETFRKELYSEYKANRSECPPELQKQMPYFRDIVKALGLPLYELPGFEADDIIGTLSKRLSGGDQEVVIVSGDKDLMQLVNDRVRVWDTMKDRHFGPAEVREKFGVPPEQIVELLALTGDTSDNVPGLAGVGPKTAVELLANFPDVEAVITQVDRIGEISSIRGRQKVMKSVIDNIEMLRLSRSLVEICTSCPLMIRLPSGEKSLSDTSDQEVIQALLRADPDRQELLSLARRFEFASLVEGFRGASCDEKEEQAGGRRYNVVFSDNFEVFLKTFESVTAFAFDTETTSLDVKEARLVGISLAWADEESWYIPFGHVRTPEGRRQVPFEEFRARCGDRFGHGDVLKCAHNLKFDLGVLAGAGMEISGPTFDTMVAAWLINPDRRNYTLDSLAQDYLRRSPVSYLDLVAGEEDIAQVDIERVAEYAGDDALNCWDLRQRLEQALEENDLMEVFRQLEMPLVPVLSRMERKGIVLDVRLLGEMSRDFGERIEASRRKLFEMAGCEFNVNSPKQIADIMFERLRIPVRGVKKTKSGYSTDQSVLEGLSDHFEFPRELLFYRMLFKLKSTYIDAFPAQISEQTGRLHSSFHQTGTATGRLSSSDPNLQNIPIQSQEGRAIRRAFVADEGSSLISADYSQIELRVLAHLSEDEGFIRAFVDGKDIHGETAREIFGIGDEEDVPADLRRVGKTINFGIVYGMGAYRLGRDLGIPLREAQRYIDNYFHRYPGIREVFARYEESAEREGYVKTLFGRRRMISEIDVSGRGRGFSARAAINAPVQGTAADLVKAAMIRIDSRIRNEKLPLALLIQIHDELLFECREDALEQMCGLIRGEMEHVAELRVPLKVEIGTGRNWEEAH